MIEKLMWPGILIVLIVSVVTVDVAMLIVATTDPSFAVAEEYESAGGTRDPGLARIRANQRLGWSADLDVRQKDDGGALIELRVADRDDAPIEGAAVSIKTFHKARAGEPIRVTLAELSPGVYVGAFPIDRAGVWRLAASITRGDDTFTDDFDHMFMNGKEPDA